MLVLHVIAFSVQIKLYRINICYVIKLLLCYVSSDFALAELHVRGQLYWFEAKGQEPIQLTKDL